MQVSMLGFLAANVAGIMRQEVSAALDGGVWRQVCSLDGRREANVQ